MREMLSLQPRFRSMRGKRAMKLLNHRRFRAAYDFMLLLSEVGQFDPQAAKFWTDVQTQSEEQRVASFEAHPRAARQRGRRRRRRPRKPAGS